MKLIIDPVQTFKSTVAEISNALILYANVYANPKPHGDEAQDNMSKEMRILSSKLLSNMHLIPWYQRTSRVFGLPDIDKVVEASKQLIYLHNGYDGVMANQGILNCYAAQKARIALGIHIPKDEYLNPDHEKSFINANRN